MISPLPFYLKLYFLRTSQSCKVESAVFKKKKKKRKLIRHLKKYGEGTYLGNKKSLVSLLKLFSFPNYTCIAKIMSEKV